MPEAAAAMVFTGSKGALGEEDGAGDGFGVLHAASGRSSRAARVRRGITAAS
ncbi:hypothetical protein Acsp02_47630 [Actinoplanes sp. NBRC 103695]|nr:hypothetical protein Acsp02_47630 [Actinoplanes sp. NBRC 103695]